MIYQETFQAGEDPNKLNISGIIYTRENIPPHSHSAMLQDTPPYGFPSHCHSFYEMDYTVEGTCQIEFDGSLIEVSSNSLIFHPPLCVHSIINDRRKSHFLLQFSHNLLMSFGNMENGCILIPDGTLLRNGSVILKEGSPTWNSMQDLLKIVPSMALPVHEQENQAARYTFSEEIRLSACVLSLLSCLLSEGNLREEHTGLLSSNLKGMQILLKRLISHPEEKLSMEEAAAFTNMSYSNFCRSFKKALGYSYVDFCNIIRVRRAQELLLNSQKSVTEISALLNFGSVSYFNRIFKKLTGCTPLAYRSSRH